jgi:hypothetical protein
VDAVLHWGIAKRECATEAQEFGFAQMLKLFDRMIDRPDEDKAAVFRSRDFFGFWQGLLRVVGSFGDCPRCLAVCPVGNDYHAHLADVQKVIPEKTPETVALAKRYKEARAAHDRGTGAELGGLSEWNVRWVGPEGYQGMVAKQLQAFKQLQRERAAATDGE